MLERRRTLLCSEGGALQKRAEIVPLIDPSLQVGRRNSLLLSAELAFYSILCLSAKLAADQLQIGGDNKGAAASAK